MNRFIKQILLTITLLFLGNNIANAVAPYKLTGECGVQTLAVKGGKCGLSASLTQAFPYDLLAQTMYKVNGITVERGFNDASSPSDNLGFTSMHVEVACGYSYKVTAFILKPGSTSYLPVGNLPTIACPVY